MRNEIGVLLSDPTGPTNSVHGYSGILVNDHFVITHGSLLSTFTDDRAIRKFLEDLKPGLICPLPGNFRELRSVRFPVYTDKSTETGSRKSVQGEPCKSGRIAAIWKCELLEETVRSVLGNWTLEKSNRNSRTLLPIFLGIHCEDLEAEKCPERILEHPSSVEDELILEIGRILSSIISETKECSVRKGTGMELSWTPFGNPVFLNSVSRGVVSNVLGADDCLVITDANGFPGCEGGPAYSINDCGRRLLCGMVIAASVWHRNEQVGYTLAIRLAPSFKRLLENQGHASVPAPPKLDDRTLAGDPERSVAVVRCGSTWGTGVLVDRESGTFLTCAHVFAEGPERGITVTRSNGGSKWSAAGRLVYKTAKDRPYDVAVLTVNPGDLDSTLFPIKFASEPPVEGEEVLSAGYPFFPQSGPTVSGGVVSKSYGCMLQTTCCVQSGASGGPIVRRATQEMLGMAVCNVISSDGTVLYPRLSLAIPAAVLRAPLTGYLNSRDSSAFQALTENDARVRSTWDLRPPYLASHL